MTVIAWDGTTLAADKRMVLGNTANGRVTKIHLARGHLTGFTGDACDGSRILHWFREGADPAKYPIKEGETNSTFVVVCPDRHVELYESGPIPLRLDPGQPLAYGTGHVAALAAMMMGADAIRAVEVASALDLYCGDGIDALTIVDAAP